MSSYNNFQSKNAKFTDLSNRSDHDPEFNPSIKSSGDKSKSKLDDNMEKYIEFLSWARFYPDLFLDLIKPKFGGMTLHSDQRIFLRSIVRFVSLYGVFPRGWGKTYNEVLAMYVVAVLFPAVESALTAQTKENAASLLKAKHADIIKFYPWFKNEIYKPKFSTNDAEVLFLNGSKIDILANSGTSKGQRRHKIMIEEAALLKNVVFEDALEPIVEIGRTTGGELAIVNPEELNQQINFFTTSGFKGTDEHIRSQKMVKNMIQLKGEIVLGSDWKLGCWNGRGSTRNQIEKKKKRMSSVAFAQNYESKWVGSVESSLVDIQALLDIRTVIEPIFEPRKGYEYFIGVDVARSQSKANNQSSISIIEVDKYPNGRVKTASLVNLINVPNTLNFTAQSIKVKKIKKQYNAKMIICDSNGLGIGLVDAMMQSQVDDETGDILIAWNTVNTDARPDDREYETCLYDLKVQGINTNIIINFIDYVETGKLRLLEKKAYSNYDPNDKKHYETNVVPFIQTDFLIEELINLQFIEGKKIKQVTKRVDKDRYSSLAYVLWYIKTYENVTRKKTNIPTQSMVLRKPTLRKR
jgi:ribonucleoside-diphosphate reductase alpha chain